MTPRATRTDYWPCPAESVDVALATLARVPWLLSWSWANARLSWELVSHDNHACKHLAIKRHVQRAISLHEVLPWLLPED